MPRLAHKRVVEIDEESSEIAAVETSSTEVALAEVPHSESDASEQPEASEEAASVEAEIVSDEVETDEAASAELVEEPSVEAPEEASLEAPAAELVAETSEFETSEFETSEFEAAEVEVSEIEVAELEVAASEVSESEASADAPEAVASDTELSATEAAARKSSSSEPSSAEAPQAEEAAEGETSETTVARPEELRLLEALLFASSEPLDQSALGKRMPDGVNVKEALLQLQADYALRGVNLVRIGTKWTFRTANDLSWLMTRESTETRRLSRAAIEVLAIIAYHQPVTRAEIEDIRGVVTSKGTLDVLLETGWIRPRGRRKTPGRPLTFGTTETFLSQFSLEALGDLPGLEELKGTGLLDSRLPSGFSVPAPSDDPALREDEDPLEPGDLDLSLAPPVEPEKPGEE